MAGGLAARHSRSSEPRLGPLDQDLPLELGERRHEVDEELPLGRRPVEGLGDRHEADAHRVEIGERVHHVAEGSEEAVAPPHDEDVELPLPRVGKESIQVGPLFTRARDAVVDVDLGKIPAASADQLLGLVLLKLRVLVEPGHPAVHGGSACTRMGCRPFWYARARAEMNPLRPPSPEPLD